MVSLFVLGSLYFFIELLMDLKFKKEENKSWSYNGWFFVKKHVLSLVSPDDWLSNINLWYLCPAKVLYF